MNRFYSPQQGRFTQVDPIGMGASSLGNPQTLNLYSYCGNDPINHVDPDGLFFGWIGKAFKWAFRVAAVLVAVVAIVAAASVGEVWGSILITKGLVALLFGSSALLATAGWGPGKIGQIAGAIVTGGLSLGGNFRTPSTFPNGTGVGGVSNFLASDPLKKKAKEEVAKKSAKEIGKAVGKAAIRKASTAVDIFIQLAYPESAGGDLTDDDLVKHYNNHVKAARLKYPGKAGKIEQHHVIPQYLGGPRDGILVPLDAAYHQLITTEFDHLWRRGSRLPNYTELQDLLTKVYSKYPLPPDFRLQLEGVAK